MAYFQLKQHESKVAIYSHKSYGQFSSEKQGAIPVDEGKHTLGLFVHFYLFLARLVQHIPYMFLVLFSSKHVYRHPAILQVVSFTGQHIVGRDPADH